MSLRATEVKHVVAALLAFLFYYAGGALAETPTCETATLETILNVPDMTVRHDTPIGAEIGTSIVSAPIDAFNCKRGLTFQSFYVKASGLAAAKINGLNIYKFGTATSGIGYAVSGSAVGTCGSFWPIIGNNSPGGVNSQLLCEINGTFPKQPIQGALKLVFYKIGNITPGKMPDQVVGGFAVMNNKTSWVTPEPQVRVPGFTVNTLGCFVSNQEIKVPMGNVDMDQLQGPGDTAAEREFSIPLTCDVGTKVKLTLGAGNAGVYDNTKGLLNLADATSTQTAQGVKVQILSNEVPVAYEKAMTMGTQASTGTFTIPLKARYYRTIDPLKPGIANSSATYTITYD